MSEWKDGDDSKLFDEGYEQGVIDTLKIRHDIQKIEWLLENHNLKGRMGDADTQ